MLLTAGERKSMALLCMALAELGVEASSFTGSQAGIVTDTDARQGQDPRGQGRPAARRRSPRGRSPSSPASRACRPTNDVTTLGRGGSDTTAVALAAALRADVCEIYTDVTGVFTADPRVVPTARRLSRVSFEEMLEMAATGGRGARAAVGRVRPQPPCAAPRPSSFTWEPGTWVTEEDASMEAPIISAVTHDTSEAKVTITGVPDKPGIAAQLFRALADESRERRHDRAEHVDRRRDRHLLHRAEGRPRRERTGDRCARRRDRGERRDARREHRAGVARRRRHEDEPRRRGDDVRDPGRTTASTSR